MHQDATLYGGRLQPRQLRVRLGPRPLSPKKGEAPNFRRNQFLANVYCGQTTAWIKIPLGAEVGLSADDIVLDGDLRPLPKKGTEPLPNFRPISVVAKRLECCMDQDGAWHGGGA